MTGRFSTRARFLLAGMFLLTVAATSSCTEILSHHVRSAGKALQSVGAAATGPFSDPDHVEVTQAHSVHILAEHRVRPATTVLGKRELTLDECRSLALSNSLDLQAARFEELTKKHIAASRRKQQYPHLTFSGELGERDNHPYTYSDALGREGESPVPGGGPLVSNWSGQTQRSEWRYVLETNWSPTDAALACYLARSACNDRMKVHYQRVRTAQKLIEVVDGAFFRLLALQANAAAADRLVRLREDIAVKIERARREKRLSGSRDFEQTQKALVEARKLRARVANRLQRQRNILASAMLISPDSCVDGGFFVIGRPAKPDYCAKPCEMEMAAVRNRPEAYEAGLNHLNSMNDLRRTIVKCFPKLTAYWRRTRTDSIFYYNRDWKEVGMLVEIDLLDVLATLDEHRGARSAMKQTRTEMAGVALGLTSEVRIKALEYFAALDELAAAEDSIEWRRRNVREKQVQYEQSALDRVAVMEARAGLLQQEMEYRIALAEANAALASLRTAMGTNYNEPHPCR